VGAVRKSKRQGRPAASRWLRGPPELVIGSIRSVGTAAWRTSSGGEEVTSPLPHGLGPYMGKLEGSCWPNAAGH